MKNWKSMNKWDTNKSIYSTLSLPPVDAWSFIIWSLTKCAAAEEKKSFATKICF